MSIENILVSYNGTDPANAAVRLAALLAKRHDAHLTGLFARSTPATYAGLESYMPSETLNLLYRQEEAQTRVIETQFHELVAAEGMTGRTSFFEEQGPPDSICSEYARTYDLAVLGQPLGDMWEAWHEPHPDTVALQSGRAVLIAPREFRGTDLHGSALLAWDGKRAAARALSEAMGLLEEHQKVLVLHVGENDAEIRKPGRDIMEHLSRHGLEAELLIEPRAGRSVGQTVLQMARGVAPGLMIMGAYEHSRLSEAILGGVTKDVLGHATTPVLIAH